MFNSTQIDLDLVNKAEVNKKSMIEAMKADANSCLIKAINTLDDGISPASDIAKGASAKCRETASKFVMSMFETFIISDFLDSTSMSSEQVESLVNRGFSGDRVVQRVLELREGKRSLQQELNRRKVKQMPKKKVTQG